MDTSIITTLDLFISYSHKDENLIDEFRTHIVPLKDENLINDWHDRKILGGEDFQNTIDNNLDNADIICLFISSDFLASQACKNEIQRAIELKKSKDVIVIPIILRQCAWLDNKQISKLMALPKDGKPVNSFGNNDDAWAQVYEGLKAICEQKRKIKEKKKITEEKIIGLKNTDDFELFLNSTDFLQDTLRDDRKLNLEDVFVYPEFQNFDDTKDDYFDSKKIIEQFVANDINKIIIAGDGQSGKTSLCKILYKKLRQNLMVPIFVSDKESKLQGDINNRIQRSFNKQYGDNCNVEEIDADRIVVIIDDFHKADKKIKHLESLSKYKHVVLIVDDVFNIDIRYNSLISDFNQYKIVEYKPTLRDELIRKWLCVSESFENDDYQKLDEKTEIVDKTLGKILGNGIMPSYPFFILSVISMYETAKPINEEISSQGYCYQALLYFYLRKNNVANEDIDEYLSFLTLFAYEIYKNKGIEISNDCFEDFYSAYYDEYNVTIAKEELISTLYKTNIVRKSSCNNYSFAYDYLYYFFAGKYFAENENEHKAEIQNIVSNLHFEENAYIAIFVSHHSKNTMILNEIIANAKSYFSQFSEASLTKDELTFFDKQANYIIQAALPQENVSEHYRKKQLKLKDEIEEQRKLEKTQPKTMEDDVFAIELKRSIKSVDVLGQILKNRSGSFNKKTLENMFQTAMNIHLRGISSFIDLIKDEESQQEIIKQLSNRIKTIIEKENRTIQQEQLTEISSTLFWNINVGIILGYTDRICKSLGSKKLIKITESICDEINTPVSEIVKHSIVMWYDKNVRIDEIANLLKKNDWSHIAKIILKYIVVNFCKMHQIDYKDAQRLQQKLSIPKYIIQQRLE